MGGLATYELTERTMLTADGRAVPAGHPGGVVLLGTAGKRIPYARAVEVGLVDEAGGSWPRHVGGGWYELEDGSRVQGKADAQAAQKALAGPAEDKAVAPGDDK